MRVSVKKSTANRADIFACSGRNHVTGCEIQKMAGIDSEFIVTRLLDLD